MGACRNLVGLMLALLLNAMFASTMFAREAYPLRITVLSVETHTLDTGTQVPNDCDLSSYSAYCHGSANPTAQSILLVQDADGRSFRIACSIDSRWSKCSPLPVGQTYDARQEKHGIMILSWTPKGKERKQFYQLVAALPAPQSGTAVDSQPHTSAPAQNSLAPAPAQHAAAPVQNSSSPALPPPPAPTQGGLPEKALAEKVKCNFSSTPSGADITVDGRYVGNTPSVIGLSTGTHVVVFSMAGFAEWKRELTVASDSLVNVTAILQKTQP